MYSAEKTRNCHTGVSNHKELKNQKQQKKKKTFAITLAQPRLNVSILLTIAAGPPTTAARGESSAVATTDAADETANGAAAATDVTERGCHAARGS